nr:hypothetical protein [Photorhabdus luminescens]
MYTALNINLVGHLSRQPRNKDGLLCLLRYHFGLPVTLNENQFHWLKNIEKDPALTRRFQVLQVAQPDEALALQMVRSLSRQLERHHGVLLLDEVLEAAVSLSHRYIPARQLPDKAIVLLDTACARVAVSQHSQPTVLEDYRCQLDALQVEQEVISACIRQDGLLDVEMLTHQLRQPLLRTFPAALLGRLTIIPFLSLSDEMLEKIVQLQLARVTQRLWENYGIEAQFDRQVTQQIVACCMEQESGARRVDSIITNILLPQMSRKLLTATMENQRYSQLKVAWENAAFECYFC